MNPSSLLTLPADLLRTAATQDGLMSPTGERAERSVGLFMLLITLVAALGMSLTF